MFNTDEKSVVIEAIRTEIETLASMLDDHDSGRDGDWKSNIRNEIFHLQTALDKIKD